MFNKKKLYKSKDDVKIGGVCSGIAEYFGIDATIVRLIAIVGLLLAGTFFFLYIVCLIVIPDKPDNKNVDRGENVKYTTYFAFNNALEACKYYEDNFNAIISEHRSLTREMADELNLDKNLDLSTTTLLVKLNIFGVDFIAADRYETPDFSDSVSLCIYFDEREKHIFNKNVRLIKRSNTVEILNDNLDDETNPTKIYRFKDQQNLIWSLYLNY